MNKSERIELIQLAKSGLSFKRIRLLVDCSDSTIRKYIKYFAKEVKNEIR